MSDADSSAPVGRRFHLVEVVGAGAFGEVYLAEQDSGAGFRRKVAIKLLHQNMEKYPEAGRRMRDEARILGRLQHRNIVTVLDLLKLGDRWAIVMDYVPGADLEQILEALYGASEFFPGPAVLEVGAAMLNALDAAYAADDGRGGRLGVIHRDIKPSNVRLTNDGEVKVLDFGVARVNLETREAQTRAQGMIGTERYMAPERILMEGDTPAGDIYAVGATLIELLTGTPLGRTPVLEGKHEPFVESALESTRPSLQGPDHVVEEVVQLLRESLAARPEDRPDARLLGDALSRLSRKLEGEDLRTFTRRFGPRVDELLQPERRKVDAVLSEGSAIPSGSLSPPTILPGRSDGDSNTYVLDMGNDSGSSTASTSTTLVIGAAGGVVAVFLVLLVIGLIGFASWYWVGGGAAPPEDLPADAAPELDVPPEPVPAPAPPEPPVPDTPPEAAEPEPPVAAAAPAPAPAPRPAPRPAPAPAPPPQPAVPPPDPNAPKIRRALVNLPNASRVVVQCGGVRGQGTTGASIRNFPAGVCTVEATHLAVAYETRVTIDKPKTVNCNVTDGAMTCQ